MAEKTKIQWTDFTFNGWRGCTKVSPGCTNCYAETLSNRNPAVLGVWGPTGTRVLAVPEQWNEPIKWNKAAEKAGVRKKIFCSSLADVFEEWDRPLSTQYGYAISAVTGIDWGGENITETSRRPFTLDDARAKLWDLIRKTPMLDWQLLTKRPENIGKMMSAGDWPNVWLGVSVESQEWAWRLDCLQEQVQGHVSVPVLFCSAEPLLGPVEFGGSLAAGGINWVIVGGESGGGARPMQVQWARSIRDECKAAGVACFIKQLGKIAEVDGPQLEGYRFALKLKDKKGGDWTEWPEDLRVREFPKLEAVS